MPLCDNMARGTNLDKLLAWHTTGRTAILQKLQNEMASREEAVWAAYNRTALVDDPEQVAATEAARHEIRAVLTQRRGVRPCRQRLPWYYYHNSNFGDELNRDLGVALLGDQSGFGMHSRIVMHTADPEAGGGTLWVTKNAKRSNKIIGIGSILGDVMPGDVVVGAGMKPTNDQLRATDHSPTPKLPESALAALRSKTTMIRAVRGTHTCRALESELGVRGKQLCGPRRQCGPHLRQTCGSPTVLGDPALVSSLLLPGFDRLPPWRPPSRVGLPPSLCVVPHMADTALRTTALHAAFAAPCEGRREAWRGRLAAAGSSPVEGATTIRVLLANQRTPYQMARAMLTCDLVRPHPCTVDLFEESANCLRASLHTVHMHAVMLHTTSTNHAHHARILVLLIDHASNISLITRSRLSRWLLILTGRWRPRRCMVSSSLMRCASRQYL